MNILVTRYYLRLVVGRETDIVERYFNVAYAGNGQSQLLQVPNESSLTTAEPSLII